MTVFKDPGTCISSKVQEPFCLQRLKNLPNFEGLGTCLSSKAYEQPVFTVLEHSLNLKALEPLSSKA
jgi:hypothetical protein